MYTQTDRQLYIYIYVCVCVYTDRQTDRLRHIQADRRTDIDTDRRAEGEKRKNYMKLYCHLESLFFPSNSQLCFYFHSITSVNLLEFWAGILQTCAVVLRSFGQQGCSI
jgi:hypothetical protein